MAKFRVSAKVKSCTIWQDPRGPHDQKPTKLRKRFSRDFVDLVATWNSCANLKTNEDVDVRYRRAGAIERKEGIVT